MPSIDFDKWRLCYVFFLSATSLKHVTEQQNMASRIMFWSTFLACTGIKLIFLENTGSQRIEKYRLLFAICYCFGVIVKIVNLSENMKLYTGQWPHKRLTLRSVHMRLFSHSLSVTYYQF